METNTGKSDAADELSQEEEQPGDTRQRRSGAPTPEPIPVTMPTNGQETQNLGAASGNRYDNCGKTSPFGVLGISNENQRPFIKVESPDPYNEKLAAMDPVIANAPKGPRAETQRPNSSVTWLAGHDAAPVNAPKGPRASRSFGAPSPHKQHSGTPVWVRDAATAPQTGRSLEDLYREHPAKKLQGGIDSNTLNLAARVVLQLVNGATLRWCRRWCPRMNLDEVFESIRVEGQEGEPTDNQHIVPSEAFDLGSMTTTLSEMFRQCHNVHPKGSGDISFPQLLNMLDKCAVFMGVLKDNKRKDLLQSAKSTFQWVPVGLDAKKLPIEKRTVANLEALNKKYEQKILTSKGDVKALDLLNQERKEEEVRLLDEAMVDFDNSRENFRIEILNGLKLLLASD